LVGTAPELAPVWSGSHLDSVPTGGYLDGPLGVVGALCAVESMIRAGHRPRRSIEVIVFVGEEGSRFPRGTIGSAAVAGHVSVAEVLALRDPDGVSYAEALSTYGSYVMELPRKARRTVPGGFGTEISGLRNPSELIRIFPCVEFGTGSRRPVCWSR